MKILISILAAPFTALIITILGIAGALVMFIDTVSNQVDAIVDKFREEK